MRSLFLALALGACSPAAGPTRTASAPAAAPATQPTTKPAAPPPDAGVEACDWERPDFDADGPTKATPYVSKLENAGREPRVAYHYPNSKGHWLDLEAHHADRHYWGPNAAWGDGWVTMPEVVQRWSIELGDAQANGTRLAIVTPGQPHLVGEGELSPGMTPRPGKKALTKEDLRKMALIATVADQPLSFLTTPNGGLAPINEDATKLSEVAYMFPQIPQQPIGVGAVWTIGRDATGRYPQKVRNRYELLAVDGKRLRIAFDLMAEIGPSRQRMNGTPAKFRSTMKIVGEAVLDLDGTAWSAHWTLSNRARITTCSNHVLAHDGMDHEARYTVAPTQPAKP